MESAIFQERVKRLKEVNEVIEKLDPAIREAALSLLSDYVTGQPTKRDGGQAHETQNAPSDPQTNMATLEGLVGGHPDGKPSDNAVLITAHLYSQYGAQPFRLDEVQAIADSVGVTIPTSLSMTLRAAKRDGKSIFQHTGRSEFKPTVHGELYLKRTYQVSKGTKQRPAQGNES